VKFAAASNVSDGFTSNAAYDQCDVLLRLLGSQQLIIMRQQIRIGLLQHLA